MSAISEITSLEEMGAIVCQALKNRDVEAFLSGGAVVSIYTQNKYESFDLDFITFGDRKKIKIIMEELGFKQDKSRFFIHPSSKYFVEFPGTSVAIGDQAITEFAERKTGTEVLRLLTPTDCIKDRLASYIHWKDQQALDQAVWVAKSQPFNRVKVQDFCTKEGNRAAYDDFASRLREK